MGEVTLTLNTLDLIKQASKELDQALEKIRLLESITMDKKKAKKVRKGADLLDAANIAIKSLETELQD